MERPNVGGIQEESAVQRPRSIREQFSILEIHLLFNNNPKPFYLFPGFCRADPQGQHDWEIINVPCRHYLNIVSKMVPQHGWW